MSKTLHKEINIEAMRKKAADMVGATIVKNFECKSVSIDKEKHTAIFVMSTENIDRYGDIVDQMSWILKYFIDNPYFAWQHMSNDFPLGRWLRVWLEEDPDNIGKMRLMGEAYFSVDIDERAKRAWDHVVEGNIRTVSVGFIPHRVDYDEEANAFRLYDCELMECSLVGIPANRQALIKDSEEAVEKAKETIVESRAILNGKKYDDAKKEINRIKALHLLGEAVRRMKNLQ